MTDLRTSPAARRRSIERVTGWLVVVALAAAIGIFALPGPRNSSRPADGRSQRSRTPLAEGTALAREIFNHADSLGGVRPRPTSEVVAELANYGSPMAPAALAVLLGEAKPLPDARGTKPLPIGPAELDDLALAVLDELPAESVKAALERVLADGRERGHELAVLRVAGSLRDPRALGLWLAVAAAVPAATFADERFQVAAARTFEALLDRRTCTRDAVRSLAAKADDPPRTLIARALARRDDLGSLGAVLAMLGRSPRQDAGLLRALAAIARTSRIGLDARDAEKVRRFAFEGDALSRADAFAALGGFGDAGSAEAMIAALDDAEELVRKSALVGLRRLSMLELGPDRKAWREWLQRETDWTEQRLGLVLQALDSADADVVATALAELSLHPLVRHALARTVGELVDDPRESVALAACAAAGALRSQAAAPALLLALRSTDDARRDAAWDALRALTGRSLPRQEQAWREVLALD
jgi:hypothetical protein